MQRHGDMREQAVWAFAESLGQAGGGFWRREGMGEVEDIGKDFLSGAKGLGRYPPDFREHAWGARGTRTGCSPSLG